MSIDRHVIGPLRLVEGGVARDAPGGNPGVPLLPDRLADDLRDPLREAERRIGFVLSGELGPVGAAHRLALGSALEALTAAQSVLDLLGRAGGGGREWFDLRFALRDAVEEIRAGARAKGIGAVLRLPEDPLPVRADRAGMARLLRFALREQMRGAPNRSRLLIRAENRAGSAEITVRGGRAGCERIAPPCRSGLALARLFLQEEGGDLLITEGGGCWTLSLPEPRETRRRAFPSSPPARPARRVLS